MDLVEAVQEIARISMKISAIDYVCKCLVCGAWYAEKLKACPGCGNRSVMVSLDGESWKKEAFERWGKNAKG